MSKKPSRTVALPETLRKAIERIAEEKEVSQHDIIKSAVALYAQCYELQSASHGTDITPQLAAIVTARTQY